MHRRGSEQKTPIADRRFMAARVESGRIRCAPTFGAFEPRMDQIATVLVAWSAADIWCV